MSKTKQALVMDVLPWPQGHGFSGTTAWWDYVLSKEESRRLDNLMGIALLDEDFGNRLLNERDDSLLMPFGFSQETVAWLRTIQATDLVEFAQAIVSGPQNHTFQLGEIS